MRPFNLEEAIAGKPVCTRDGHRVKLYHSSHLSDKEIFAIVDCSFIGGFHHRYNRDGNALTSPFLEKNL